MLRGVRYWGMSSSQIIKGGILSLWSYIQGLLYNTGWYLIIMVLYSRGYCIIQGGILSLWSYIAGTTV